MSEAPNCENWEVGKESFGLPAKFVYIKLGEDNFVSLDDYIKGVLLTENNLSEIDSTEARLNLDVYSKGEVDALTGDATVSRKGIVQYASLIESTNYDVDKKASSPRTVIRAIREVGFGSGSSYGDYTDRLLNTFYKNNYDRPVFLNITATVTTSGTHLQIKDDFDNIIAISNTAPASGKVCISCLITRNASYQVVQVGGGSVTINKWTER